MCVCVQVIRGLREGRDGLVETQRQFEFLHQVLEDMVWGGEETEDTDGGGKASRTKNKKTKGLQGKNHVYSTITCLARSYILSGLS